MSRVWRFICVLIHVLITWCRLGGDRQDIVTRSVRIVEHLALLPVAMNSGGGTAVLS
jgi:hypothetical protein